MQAKIKSVAWFAGGMASGVGVALVSSAVNSRALAAVSLIVTLGAGIFLGRSSCDAVAPPADDEADDEADDWPMIPDKSIPMDHTHGEDDDENADL